ncbi:hypothetical protein CI610_01831 [invertebrate metagenome]|uniref:DinB-like domain-containing protein n=1 Tax=invertebrate metagenome TaxID=1711999 RepID=A0A2H9T7L3_9ZZZZ
MPHEIIETIVDNLSGSRPLYTQLQSSVFSSRVVGPYYSSIGQHMRHILDTFSCALRGMNTTVADLTERERNSKAETDQKAGLVYLDSILDNLQALGSFDLHQAITVLDDLGKGPQSVEYSVVSLLCQTNSHMLHHFALIGYLLHFHNVDLPNTFFGYNPTTPMVEKA